MVMEASPSPQSVGREFVRQYYTLLNKAPEFLHRFYSNYSLFVHGGLDAPNRETLPVVGQKQIHTRIQQLNFRDCHAKISQVDSQATLGNGVVVQVTGELSNGGAPMRRFTQTFVLAAQSPKKYYVHNDIFRYQDVVFPDDDGDASGRSDAEEDEAAGFFPPPPANFPAPFPTPTAPPAAALPTPTVASAPVAPEPSVLAPVDPPAPSDPPTPTPAPAPALNGHPSPGEPAPPTQASAAPVDEPEPEVSASTPPPAAAPEPITYATLLKSAPGAPAAPRAPPTAAAPPGERAPRAPPAPPAAPPAGPERRYSDAQQLFLGNLPHGAPEEELRALFARFGPVAELRVHSKAAAPGAPRHPNYGFITYETHQAAQDCLKAAPLFFPAEGEGAGVKLNVEEKKTRGREPPRRRPVSSQRPAFRQPYRR